MSEYNSRITDSLAHNNYYTFKSILGIDNLKDELNVSKCKETFCNNCGYNIPNDIKNIKKKKCDGSINYDKNLYCWEGIL